MTRLGRSGVPAGVAPGEKVLAWARTGTRPDPPAGAPAAAEEETEALPAGEVVAATRDAMHLVGAASVRIPWAEVERVDWDVETGTLTVVRMAPFGEPQPTYRMFLEGVERLLTVVRERVEASVVLRRPVAVPGHSGGVRLVGRRAPGGRGAVRWFFEYDEGVDPGDADVQAACRAALEAAELDITPQ